ARIVRLLYGGFEPVTLAHELAAHIDVSGVSIHGASGDQAPFNKVMRIMAQDFAVLAGAGLGFVRVDDEIVRATVADLGHEAPFEASREPRTATAAQARCLD